MERADDVCYHNQFSGGIFYIWIFYQLIHAEKLNEILIPIKYMKF